MRRLLGLAGLAGIGLAAAAYVRRTAGHRRERVDLYYEDGSMISLGDGAPDAERLLPLARDILRGAR